MFHMPVEDDARGQLGVICIDLLDFIEFEGRMLYDAGRGMRRSLIFTAGWP